MKKLSLVLVTLCIAAVSVVGSINADSGRYVGKLGRYFVESFLGRGGMGVVLRAYDPQLQSSA